MLVLMRRNDREPNPGNPQITFSKSNLAMGGYFNWYLPSKVRVQNGKYKTFTS
jgi:hypothetical protein